MMEAHTLTTLSEISSHDKRSQFTEGKMGTAARYCTTYCIFYIMFEVNTASPHSTIYVNSLSSFSKSTPMYIRKPHLYISFLNGLERQCFSTFFFLVSRHSSLKHFCMLGNTFAFSTCRQMCNY